MYLFLVSVIFIRFFSDIFFKLGVHHIDFQFKNFLPSVVKMIKNPFFILAIFFSIANVVIWTLGLTLYDLSFAYPFTSFSYILIILAGKFIFHEHLDRNKMIGIVFILIGSMTLLLG
ncbi:MAG: hypothetical protein HRT90_08335 [Candidatus Margulisbacteria bacterium]|nr:hypothetical protein [Candidatus Margulisiibacteriota bacterium]